MFVLLCVAALAASVSASPAPAGPRVSGGSETSIENHPYAAALLYTFDDAFRQHLGTAVIINNRSVLTLASWIYDQMAFRWHVRVGSSFANSGGVVHDVATEILHPDWKYEPFDSDIAVLRVAQEFIFGSSVQPTAIAGAGYSLAADEPVLTIGWGQTYAGGARARQLQEVQVKTVDQDTCSSSWAAYGYELASNMMCAGDLEEEKGVCAGDFGSPLLHDGVVVGVATYRQLCGQAPGLYTRVSDFTDWIVDNA